MARAASGDFFHSMRFHVNVVDATFEHQLGASRDGQNETEAGFNAVSTPELTTEGVEYKEGIHVYTQKYPGNPTVSDITLSRGVTTADTVFWDWARSVPESDAAYRADLNILHFHRTGFLKRSPTDGSGVSNREGVNATPARIYKIYEAFPIRCKVATDLDGTSSEISIAEMDVAYESFDVLKDEAVEPINS